MSLLSRFWALTKGGAAGFGGGLGGPKRVPPRPLPLVIAPDGAKGLMGVVGGSPAGFGGRAGPDIVKKIS